MDMNSLRMLLSVAPLFLGCVAETTAAGPAPSPLVSCSGEYLCDPRYHWLARTLRRDDNGVCWMGDYRLVDDGKLMFRGKSGSWTGDASRFVMCVDGDPTCVTCEAGQSAEAPSTPGAQCTGSPNSCSSNSPGSCAQIRGCSMTSHVRYDGTWENECDGTPDDCESITPDEACVRQGCDWK